MENTSVYKNPYLIIGSLFSFAFALFQLSAIVWTPDQVRAFGGPVTMQAENFGLYAFLCVFIAALVAVAGLYALAGAGKFRRLPLMRTVLTGVTTIYLLRGLQVINDFRIIAAHPEEHLDRFVLYSSGALVIGVVHLIGLVKYFRHLRAH